MRKVLLTAAAFAVIGAGSAMASDSESVTVQTIVPEFCQVNVDDGTVALPFNGDPAPAWNFAYRCNYSGDTAVVTFTSTSLGVTDGVTVHAYNIVSTEATGTSAAPVVSPGLSTTAGSPVLSTFTLDLVNPIVLAGTYTDTLTVSIAP